MNNILTRRQLLTGTLAASGLAVAGGHLYLHDEEMQPAPQRGGKILADLHTHPHRDCPLEEILSMLSSPGLVGLAHISGHSQILTYERALALPGAEEVEPGLAQLESSTEKNSPRGYFTRTQEINGGVFHILAVAWKGGGYFENYADARKAVEEIHRKDGVAIVNHPFITSSPDAMLPYRFINGTEENELYELLAMTDEAEIFNAQCINPLGGFLVPNMKKANERAERLVGEYAKLKGTISSDARIPEQVKSCGIYLEEKDFCMEKLKADLRESNFENDFRHYASKWSFLKGMFMFR